MPDLAQALAAAEELARKDLAVASELDRVTALGRRADTIRARAEGVAALLANGPGELAEIEREQAAVRDAARAAVAAVEAAERDLGDAGGRRNRRDGDEAERTLERARERAAEAESRRAALERQRDGLLAALAAARDDAGTLVAEARDVAHDIGSIAAASSSGREPPGDELESLSTWGSRVHASLFVVRGQLERERERLVREANELGGSALGEQLGGASVALVRKRLEAEARR